MDQSQIIALGAAVVIAVVAIFAARFVSARVGWAAAGPLALIALTPLVPRVRIGLGLSLDDVLPIVGFVMLVPALRAAWPLAVRSRAHRVLLATIIIGVVLSVIAGALASLLNASDPLQFVRYLARSAGRYAALSLLALAVATVVRQRGSGKSDVAIAIAVMGTIEAAFGLFAFLVPLPDHIGLGRVRPRSALFQLVPGRVSGTLGLSPNFTGAVLMVSTLVTVGLAARATTGRARVAWGLAAAMQLITLALTFSRAPIALAVVGVAVVLVLASRPVLMLLLTAAMAVVVAATPILGRFLSDVTDRLALWYTAIQMMLDHPIGGVGPGQMVNVMRANPEQYMNTPVGRAVSNAHNTILLAGAETGVLGAIGILLINLGLAVMAGMVLYASVRARHRDILAVAGSVAVLCFLAQGMVNNLFTVGVTSVMLALVVGALVLPALASRGQEMPEEGAPPLRFQGGPGA